MKRSKEKPATPLYFLAIIPGKEFQEKVTSIKEHFAHKYNSDHALRSPPHITVHMPFKWREDSEKRLFQTLSVFGREYHPFNVELENYGSFSPKVIYINVIKSDLLIHFQSGVNKIAKTRLKLFNANHKDKPFHPHMTVAFRDLKRHDFHKAWEEFKNKEIHHEFMANALSLLKHNGKFWEVYRDFELQNV